MELSECKAFEPDATMPLANYIGGLSHHTKIPKPTLAALARVTVKTVCNWKMSYLDAEERKERAKPVAEALSKIIDEALENFRIRIRKPLQHLTFGFGAASCGCATSRASSNG